MKSGSLKKIKMNNKNFTQNNDVVALTIKSDTHTIIFVRVIAIRNHRLVNANFDKFNVQKKY